MKSKATTVAAYIAAQPEDRRATLTAIRNVIRANLDADYEEGMQYGMVGYYVPHRVFPDGYHCDPKQPLPFAALAAQKNHMSLHLMGIYFGCGEGADQETMDAKWFREAWAKTGKKLDMGKACVRFKKLDDVALDVLGEAIRRLPAKAYVRRYLELRDGTGAPKSARSSARKVPVKTTKKVAKTATKKVAKKAGKARRS